MRIAQTLYEGVDFGDGPTGLITYMRTDSVFIAKGAQDSCLDYIRESYGDKFAPPKPNVYQSRGSAQEAHEAIRPTDMLRTPDSLKATLKPDELKLYTLIWKRFVASQMTMAKIAQRTYEIDARGSHDSPPGAAYLFRASTSEILFPGYMKVMGTDVVKKPKRVEEEEHVPTLEKGEELNCLEWLKEQKFTQPLPRYSEASLVRALEENGVGRPSTYAQVISTILDREYVTKEKRTLTPTELGMNVNEFLVGNLGELFDVGFTAHMEELLDNVERGKVQWTGMLQDFYGNFTGWLEKSKGPEADPEAVAGLFELLQGVSKWAAPTQRGKRTFSDEAFVLSIRKQLEEGKKEISQRQVAALVKLVAKYREQLTTDPKIALKDLGLEEMYASATSPKALPRPETQRKLDLLKSVTFDEPRTVGKRTYDDSDFSASLREQVENGDRLSPNQLRYLDRVVLKYSRQIPDFEKIAEELGLDLKDAGPDEESGPLLALLKEVEIWKEPVQRGKRTWDDKEIFGSLSEQFEGKKSLSVKQRALLKKMCKRYADQISEYDSHIEKLGLPPPGKKKSMGKKTVEGEEAPAVA